MWTSVYWTRTPASKSVSTLSAVTDVNATPDLCSTRMDGPAQVSPLQWLHNECDGVSNHQPHDCLLNRLFRRRSKKTSKLLVTGLREGNSPVTGEFPHKGPVARKKFPFNDVIMPSLLNTGKSCNSETLNILCRISDLLSRHAVIKWYWCKLRLLHV